MLYKDLRKKTLQYTLFPNDFRFNRHSIRQLRKFCDKVFL